MQNANFKQLVLVGGGHAHALLIKMWGMNPLPGVQLILVSPSWRTPYSGMLPGLLAGHYSVDDIHIDLRKLCCWAGVRFIQSRVDSINPVAKTVSLIDRDVVNYDLLSLDIGSTPDLSVPGVAEFAQAVKPISLFYPRFQALLQRCRDSHQPLAISVVGGGAGGVEVVLALAQRLRAESLSGAITLLLRNSKLLAGYTDAVSRMVKTQLATAGVQLLENFDVAQVTLGSMTSTTGQQCEFDEVFFCTQAIAANWLFDAGLACDERGFVKVRRSLQSLSHADIFAVGDIAAMVDTPRSKAGVYAVRQAPVLLANLKRALLQQPLKPFKPQQNFLSLLSLGGKKALANRGNLSLSHQSCQSMLWRWKDKIDRKFMAMLSDLPVVKMVNSVAVDRRLIPLDERDQEINPEMRCAGCGGKVGTDILQQVLTEVTGQREFEPEDAATVMLGSRTLIQSVDQIKAPIDDPYVFGRIATLHALSDAFAMNANPTSSQLLLNMPYAGDMQQGREMAALMRGVLKELQRHDCKLIGGHTAEGADLSVGLVVNAEYMTQQAATAKGGFRVGDQLVLTKPLGTGVILAAHMRSAAVQARGDWVNGAIDNMLQSNAPAAAVFSELDVSACTDVTGFGLVGHLTEMLRASAVTADLYLADIPLLDGALQLSEAGVKSSLYQQNAKALKALSIAAEVAADPRFALLFDPQTSGGLLVGLPPNELIELEKKALPFWRIGEVVSAVDDGGWDMNIL